MNELSLETAAVAGRLIVAVAGRLIVAVASGHMAAVTSAALPYSVPEQRNEPPVPEPA